MRPHVICHMMSPLDGRLAVADWSGSPQGGFDERVAEYERVHDSLEGDAWLAGRVTMEEFATGEPHPPASFDKPARPHHFAGCEAEGYAIAVDPHGKLHWTAPDIEGDHVVVALGPDVPDAHLAELAADGVSYVVATGSSLDLAGMLDTLGRDLGIKRLLLEGGGGMNGAFLRAGLVDEISLVVFPAIDGRSGGRTIFEGGDEGLADAVSLTLSSCEVRRGGGVHLRYAVAGR
ncbi:RibD family protein [Methylobacterium sp. J-068]|uniref:RibD family protein n=1 Tax=Methylobacterium sp. J-068 TaxID=2836649 RepID=UPI001FBA5318|nr:RibD family protein [Methylobacterium sp. J-068]MCJ2036008.1 RibD family protein [Methylobacterium sp. J-068]